MLGQLQSAMFFLLFLLFIFVVRGSFLPSGCIVYKYSVVAILSGIDLPWYGKQVALEPNQIASLFESEVTVRIFC